MRHGRKTQLALKSAGVEFIHENGGGPGVSVCESSNEKELTGFSRG